MKHIIVLQLSNGQNIGTFDYGSTAPVPRIGEAVAVGDTTYLVKMILTAYPESRLCPDGNTVYTSCEVVPI